MVEFLHFDIQSTGQKSHRVNTDQRPSRCFVLIRQSCSQSPCQFCAVRLGRTKPATTEIDVGESHGLPRTRAGGGPSAREHAQPSQRTARFLPRPETARTSEPILIPKLRIGFADFPYLHCSIDQRLFTLETCCGFGYGLERKLHCLPRIFKGQRRCTGRRVRRDALRMQRPYLWTSQFQGVRS